MRRGRYIYQPLNYDEYMKNYINTLKTGELLVDFHDYDIYVTEEGLNIPIPITKNLREKVLDFIRTNLDTPILKKSQISEDILNTSTFKYKIEQNQAELYDRGLYLYNREADSRNKAIILEKITQRNINQLGDISLQLNNLPIDDEIAKMKEYVERWNRVNNVHNYTDHDPKINSDLKLMWDNIVQLMNIVNRKLDSLGHSYYEFTEYNFHKETYQGDHYDIYYDDFLDRLNFNGLSPEQWRDRCNGQLYKLKNFVSGTTYNGMNIRGPWYNGYCGTGMFYKNFPFKRDERFTGGATGKYGYVYQSYPGSELQGSASSYRRVDWDAAQTVPNRAIKNLDPNSIDYIRNPANWSLSRYMELRKDPSSSYTINYYRPDENSFRTQIPAADWGRHAGYPGVFNTSSYSKVQPMDLDLDAISYVDPHNPNQRLPRETGPNISKYPARPVITHSSTPWHSIRELGVFPNTVLYQVRVGVTKRFNTTTIKFTSKSGTKGIN